MRPSRTGIVEDIGRVSAELREKLRNCQSDASFLYAASYQLSAFSFADLESQAAHMRGLFSIQANNDSRHGTASVDESLHS